MHPSWCRWSWVGLILVQPLWFLVINPPGLIDPWFATAVWLVPLLALSWWVLRLRPRGLVLGGALLLLHFSFAVSEAWAAPDSRIIALVQIGLVTAYFLGLLALRRGPAAGARR